MVGAPKLISDYQDIMSWLLINVAHRYIYFKIPKTHK